MRRHRPQRVARGQEQERLQAAVRQQMEDRRRERADAARHDHEADLADGRVREDLLDVGLRQRDQRREDRRRRADHRDDGHGDRRKDEERAEAHQQEGSRVHHGRGVDERRDRGWRLHGERQPHVQRQLGRLARRPREQQERDHGRRRHRPVEPRPRQQVDGLSGDASRARQERGDVERAERLERQEHAGAEADVGHRVDQERLDGRAAGGLAVRPVGDQQIRADPHGFPAHVGHEQITAHDQRDHGGREERDDGEEARVARVANHVARRVHVHDRADARHEEQQQHRELVDEQAEVHHQGDRRRGPGTGGRLRPLPHHLPERHDRETAGEGDRRGAHSVAGVAEPASRQRQHDTRQEREQWNQEQEYDMRSQRFKGAVTVSSMPTTRSLKRPSMMMPAHSPATQTRAGSGISGARCTAGARSPNTRTSRLAKYASVSSVARITAATATYWPA